MERSEIILSAHNIIGSDEHQICTSEIDIFEISVQTTCQCGETVDLYNDIPLHCICGRKHVLTLHLHTEWSPNPNESGDDK